MAKDLSNRDPREFAMNLVSDGLERMKEPVRYNPMGFRIHANQATPEYVVYDDVRAFVAYGLMCSHFAKTIAKSAGCKLTDQESIVTELRLQFIELIEHISADLWTGDVEPDSGFYDRNRASVFVGETDEYLEWCADLREDGIMLEITWAAGENESIWISYGAINDRVAVANAVNDARSCIGQKCAPEWFLELTA